MNDAPRADMVAALGIDPQDGDLDFLLEIEAVFDVHLRGEDVSNWRTLGDIHQTLLRLLADRPAGDRCPTAMAYYRLRRALIADGHQRVRPSTPLAHLRADNPRRLLARLSKATGLRLPTAEARRLGKLGGYLVLVGLVGAIVAGAEGHIAVASGFGAGALLGVAFLFIDRGRFPPGVRTLGDLARRTAALSRAKLGEEGAREVPGGVWATLAAIAAEHSGLDADRLGPQTYIFRHVYEQDRKSALVH